MYCTTSMTLSTEPTISFVIFIMKFPSTRTSGRLFTSLTARFGVMCTLMWMMMMMMEISVYAGVERDCYGVVMIR